MMSDFVGVWESLSLKSFRFGDVMNFNVEAMDAEN